MASQALIVRGGWDGHSPVETTDSFVDFLTANDFTVQIEDSPAVYADESVMDAVDLVVQCVTMSTIEPEQVNGLVRAVENGTGLAGWHGGIADSYRNTVEYQLLTGGQFIQHAAKPVAERTPDTSDVFVDYTVHLNEAARTHPITEGLSDFAVNSELYWVQTDAYNDVLATITQPAGPDYPWNRAVEFPAIWTRNWGKGRVFVTTVGHKLDDLAIPEQRTIIERGMLWAAR